MRPYTLRVAFQPDQIGRRVREEREKAGLSLAQLASLAGLTKAYLVRLETQPANPSLEVLAQIADALDLTVGDLVNAPLMRFADEEPENTPPSLRAFADEAKLSTADVRMLKSIRWRRGEQPQSPERWRFVYDSLRASRTLDPSHS